MPTLWAVDAPDCDAPGTAPASLVPTVLVLCRFRRPRVPPNPIVSVRILLRVQVAALLPDDTWPRGENVLATLDVGRTRDRSLFRIGTIDTTFLAALG